jgi:diacylglycerol kinase family enzyme
VGWLTFFKNGEQENRFFINVADLAYDGFVAKKAEAQGDRMSNRIFYLLLIFRCLFQFNIPKIRVTFDGQTVEDFLYTVNVGICRYSGGGLRLVPQALPADGKLALTLVLPCNKFPFLYTSRFKQSSYLCDTILSKKMLCENILALFWLTK